MAAVDAVDGFPMKDFDIAAQQRSMSMLSSAQEVPATSEPATHAEDFKRRTGMTPRACYRLVLASLMLRLIGGCWIGMVSLEYGRYYVMNDLGFFDVIRTATGSPQYAAQAFLFPFWGVVADRVSRKKVIVAASLAACATAWMFTIVPCVEVYVLTRFCALVSEVGGPIRDAMLRDGLTTDEWENSKGGVTGVKARLFLVGQIAFGWGTLIGLGIVKLGEYGYGLPNEYTVHKHECGETYCLPRGHWSWSGPWTVDGCLRLLMIMGSVIMTADSFIVCFLFPETLPPEFRRETSLWNFLKSSWHEAGRPWDNLRVLATRQLRSLMAIRFLSYVVAAGGGSIFMSFYSRFEFDTFTMAVHTVIAGAVGHPVDRYGDLRGIWLPGKVLALLYGISCAVLPPGYGYMVYAIWPTFAGTSFALGGMAPELLAKFVPSDLQTTYQTAKSFVFRLTMAVFAWPWNQIFVHTHHFQYPLDGIPILVAIALGSLALFLTLRKLRDDPRDAIIQGRALDAFWESPYAKGEWYRRHAGGVARQPAPSAAAEDGVESPPRLAAKCGEEDEEAVQPAGHEAAVVDAGVAQEGAEPPPRPLARAASGEGGAAEPQSGRAPSSSSRGGIHGV